MTTRQIAAAVFALILSGVGIQQAYQTVAADNPPLTPTEVRDETRAFVVRVASMLRSQGVAEADAVTKIAARTGVTEAQAAPIVHRAYVGGAERDPEATYSHQVAIAARTADVATVEAAVIAAVCSDLRDVADGGVTADLTECLSRNTGWFGERLCNASNVEVARGSRARMTPPMYADVIAALPAEAFVLDDATNARYAALLASRSLQRCADEE